MIAVIAIVLFIGGIFLLVFSIPFWSYFLGIPAVQIGIIFMIFAFEKLSNEEINREIDKVKDEQD